MNDLVEHIERNIRERRLLRDGQPLLVAVSGGVDSMVLLHALHELAGRHRWQLTVAHLNHQLRGRSSDADERLVFRTAEQLSLPFVSDRADVRRFARGRKLSLEMAARQLRHDFLARAAVRLEIPTIALAHHADDRVELFFLRLLRGSGSEGLTAMKWRGPSPGDPEVQLVRPLLDLPKSALRQFASRNKIRFREDISNRLGDFLRNRIRRELLPLLRTKFQPALNKTVARVMDILGAEAECINETAARWLSRSRRAPFERLPVAVQRRCLQLQLLKHGVAADFDLVEQLRAKPDRPVTVSPQFAVSRDPAGRIQPRHVVPAKFNPNRLEVDLGRRAGEVCFDCVTIRWAFDSRKPQRVPPVSPGREFFDAGRTGRKIQLRHWQPGDRFQPIGMASPARLQDLFTNRKIPAVLRRDLVVATTARGEVFWVEGLRIGERFKLGPRTRRRLRWAWHRGLNRRLRERVGHATLARLDLLQATNRQCQTKTDSTKTTRTGRRAN